ncbi:MAG: replication protein RepA [Cyanobacteria bacterium P01_D01_bin.36]
MPKKKLTVITNRLLDTVVKMQQADHKPDIGFTPHALVQAALPYRNSKKLEAMDAWSVQNGNFGLTIRPGWDRKAGAHIGYPTGAIPRLLLYWLTTEAKLKQSRRLELGGSLREFLLKLGMNANNGSGKRSDKRRVREQMQRLFRATISFDYTVNEKEHWLDMQVAPKGQVMWSEMYPDAPTLFDNWIELSEYFYEAIVQKAVPINMDVLPGIHDRPMALDLYTWISYRAWTAYRSNKAQRVPWPSLYQQLGSSYTRVRAFRDQAKENLLIIQHLYPDLKLDEADNCLIIKPSRPSVPERLLEGS